LVSYRKEPLAIGIKLIRGHASETDCVALARAINAGDSDIQHRELQRDKAGTDRRLLRAITKNVRQLRATRPGA
jgi:hypothetical protein